MRIASDVLSFLIPSIVIFLVLSIVVIITDILYLDYILFASLLFILFLLFFFRDPDRTVPQDKNSIISPSDGKVLLIDDKIPGYIAGCKHRISIFLSMLDVHINRVPVDGKITKVEYKKGRFFPAFREKASELNEHTVIEIENSFGKISFCQRAGSVARRIICNLSEGKSVMKGERFGMIRFGSRVDIYFPANVIIHSRQGDRVKGGETILAEFSANES